MSRFPAFALILSLLLGCSQMAWAAPPPAPAKGRVPISGERLRQLMPGSSLLSARDGAIVAEYYAADGRLQRVVAGKVADGRWWVEGERLCTAIGEAAGVCWPVSADGSVWQLERGNQSPLLARRVDGDIFHPPAPPTEKLPFTMVDSAQGEAFAYWHGGRTGGTVIALLDAGLVIDTGWQADFVMVADPSMLAPVMLGSRWSVVGRRVDGSLRAERLEALPGGDSGSAGPLPINPIGISVRCRFPDGLVAVTSIVACQAQKGHPVQ